MYVYVVSDDRFVSVYEVFVVVVSSVPPLYILYPAVPVLSVDADHVSAICDEDSDVADSAVGCVGAWVSGVVVVVPRV